MNNYLANSLFIGDREKEPEYYKKYVHLSNQELKWICNRNGYLFEYRAQHLKEIKPCYKDLRYLEKDLLNGIIPGYASIPSWYIIQLVAYGRIDIPATALHKIHFKVQELKGSTIVDYEFIEDFCRIATKKLGYTKGTLVSIIIELIRMFLLYKCSYTELADKFEDYKEKIFLNRTAISRFACITNIFRNMGYASLKYTLKANRENKLTNYIISDEFNVSTPDCF